MTQPIQPCVLIVDDEEILCSVLAEEFEDKNYHVFQANNGQSALEAMKTHPEIQLILSDIRMPKMNGIELLSALKASNRDVPIFMMMTGYSDLSLAELYNSGAEAVLEKPFNQKLLFETVAHALVPRQESWGQQQPETSSFKLELPNTQTVSLGRGGMFVSQPAQWPNIGTTLSFQLADFKGTGIVRWVRRSAERELPAGYGVEFQTLTPQSIQQLKTFLDDSRIIAFIPKR